MSKSGRRGFELLLCVVTLLSTIALASWEQARAESAERRDRLILGYFFTSNSKQAAFPVEGVAGGIDIMIVDLETGNLRKLRSQSGRLLSPFLSRDGQRILLVRVRNDTQEYELLSCTTTDFVCARLLASKGSINSPIEVSGNKILYIASPRRIVSGARSQFFQHDLWDVEKGKAPRQLTDLQFFEMNWLSATSIGVYFSAMGSRVNRKIIPKYAPIASTYSDIFKLPFDEARAIQLPKALPPLFLEKGRSTASQVAPDESLAALLRTQFRRGGFRYDLVVIDLTTQKSSLIESTGLGFSRPAVVDQKVIAREIFEDRYAIREVAAGEVQTRTIVEIADNSIAAAEPTEIRVLAEVP